MIEELTKEILDKKKMINLNKESIMINFFVWKRNLFGAFLVDISLLSYGNVGRNADCK